ncbi:hypothetical protein ABVN80_10800 [Acinetobacter baumannii]
MLNIVELARTPDQGFVVASKRLIRSGSAFHKVSYPSRTLVRSLTFPVQNGLKAPRSRARFIPSSIGASNQKVTSGMR